MSVIIIYLINKYLFPLNYKYISKFDYIAKIMDPNNNQQQQYNPNAPQGYQQNYNNNEPQNYNQGNQPMYNPNMQHQQNYNPNAPQGYQQNYNPNAPQGYQQNYNPQNPEQHHLGQRQMGMPGAPLHQISKNMTAYFETNSYMTALENAEFAFIKQKVEILEILTGCETKNRYKVYVRYPNGSYYYLFKAKEDSDCCERQCCS